MFDIFFERDGTWRAISKRLFSTRGKVGEARSMDFPSSVSSILLWILGFAVVFCCRSCWFYARRSSREPITGKSTPDGTETGTCSKRDQRIVVVPKFYAWVMLCRHPDNPIYLYTEVYKTSREVFSSVAECERDYRRFVNSRGCKLNFCKAFIYRLHVLESDRHSELSQHYSNCSSVAK